MPSGTLDLPDISRVYARFSVLTASSAEPGGSLLLYARLDSEGIAVATASNIAGAASLGLEPDVERAKAALRGGVCDFVVNHLDESLRILKNEIRKRRAVSVVLTAEPEAAVAEIIVRGVQPEMLAFSMPELMARGARLLTADEDDGLVPVSWSVEREGQRWLPVLDALAASSLMDKDARQRWLESAPRYLGRAFVGQRFLRMSHAEADAFLTAVRNAVESGAVPDPVSVTRGGSVTHVTP